MIFDIHSDILCDIVTRRLRGQKGIVESYHLPELLEGNVTGGVWSYSHQEAISEICRFDQSIQLILEELADSLDIQVVTSKGEWTDHKMNIILGLSGLDEVQDISHLIELYNKGFRQASLVNQGTNQYGTGINCSDGTGLSLLGCEVIKKMNELGMVIDVSGASQQMFDDILSLTKQPVIVSHANCDVLSPYKGNLTDEQLKEIANVDGVVGLTTLQPGVPSESWNVKAFVDHIDYLRDLIGVRYIAFGFKFTNYFDEQLPHLIDCQNATAINNIIDELISRGYSSTEIDAITHVNAKRVINHILRE